MAEAKNTAIGIIAGGGQFPRLIAEGARRAGLQVAICGFQGHTSPELQASADAFTLLHIGQFNKLIHFFQQNKVTRLCMAGSINKPRALDFRPDLRAAKLVFSLRHKGDDSLLRAIFGELEREGFHLLSAADLVPELRCPPGLLTRTPPDSDLWSDIRYGWPIALNMGAYDIGQCLVVKQGMVVAVECLEGTDATLKRGADLGGAGCTALKLAKPGQDERVDLPSVGLETINILLKGQYRGLAIQAHKTLFFDREASIDLANKHKFTIIALEENDQALENA